MALNRKFRRCLLLAFLFLPSPFCVSNGSFLAGQALTGSISGIVSDTSDAHVPGAAISIRNVATNEARATVSDDSGTFTLSSIAPGVYEVTTQKLGFERSIVTNLQVSPGANTRIDVKVKIGMATEAVSVSADAAIVQTDSAEVRGELDNKQLTSVDSSPRLCQSEPRTCRIRSSLPSRLAGPVSYLSARGRPSFTRALEPLSQAGGR